MRNKTYRFFPFLVTNFLLIIISMTACTAIQPEDEQVTITFAAPGYTHDMFTSLVEDFHQQNPSVTVQLVEAPQANAEAGNYFQSLASSADSVFLAGRDNAMSAYFRDLQPQIETDVAFQADDFWPGALATCQDSQGQVLGLPLNLSLAGLFYDPAAFDAAGLPHPQPGWNWNDFQTAIATLSQSGRYGLADRSYLSILQPQIIALLQANNGEIDSQTFTEALKWYLDAANENLIYPLQENDSGWVELFHNDPPPAMWVGRLYELLSGPMGITENDTLFSQIAISALGYSPMPEDLGGTNSNTNRLVGSCAAISVGSQHPQAAWDWITYLSHQWLVVDPNQSVDRLQIPARQSVADGAGFWTNIPEGIEESIRYGLAHAYTPGLYPEAEALVFEAVTKALAGTMDLPTALQQAEAKLAERPQMPAGDAQVTIATPEPTEQQNANAVSLQFYLDSATPAEREILNALADDFNQTQNEIRVNIAATYSPNKGYYEGFATKFDCFAAQMDASGAGDSGFILGLNALVERENNSFLQDYDQDLLSTSRYQGEFVVWPFLIQPSVMVYNADLLKQKGLELPSLDWTFDAFMEYLTAVANPTSETPTYGFTTNSASVDTSNLLLAGHGVKWLDLTGDLPTASINTPSVANGIVWLDSLFSSGILYQPPAEEDAWRSIVTAIESGQIAFWTVRAGEQTTELFDPGQPPSFEIGILPLPSVPDNDSPFDSGYERGFYISNQAEHPEACWTWITYLSEQAAGFDGIPARRSVANSSNWEASVGAENAAIYRLAFSQRQNSQQFSFPAITISPLEVFMGDAQFNIGNGSNAQVELALAQQKADAYYACMLEENILSLETWEVKDAVWDCMNKVNNQ